ncbi:sodium- and chloride-dependent GABA transporter 1-like [Dendronephthya gigantea]|uniref:sodium- and chloride-dependent GABA transporter 1-like n=1 Tax=Dendronephthya gigantea TaxID=151771 RepID=UPI00106A3D20|nr:sodium- and chloride-dependent GABA transporter 1-like [Dendronephthya gigantea]XP_028392401.1 sodium- and chloride-dependent GABA transporter 1-like [Dendronephthya gigantea]XP_028392402.1 sodium- and chloride-dependent GABA transporter 1-like [Dendronephthya gigantea]
MELNESLSSKEKEDGSNLIPSKNSELSEKPGLEDGAVEEGDDFEREKWSKKVEFFLSAIGYAVGLGNVWRFPYLAFKHGGGAFLIPYILMLIICGMPLFFMELALGQHVSLGPVSSWAAICPIAKGIGYSMMVVSFLCTIYYNVIIAWCLYYLAMSFRSEVPWRYCGNWWNTDNCAEKGGLKYGLHIEPSADVPNVNVSSYNSSDCVNNTIDYFINGTSVLLNCSRPKKELASPSSEFWNNHVLRLTDGIDEVGELRWQLVIALILAWILVYFCLWKGIKSSGKVVYFTATFPYMILVVLFFRGITLSGASKGVLYYIKPDFSKLGDADVWVAAATQIFYSLGIGFGSLVTYGSFNKYNNDCVRDAVIVTIINCSTSIFAGFVIFSVLGHMADILQKDVSEVAQSGPGLAFVVYPEAIAQMPVSPLWAILFFFMLLTLGLDTQFAMLEAVVTGLVDEYGKKLRKRKELVILALCVVAFFFGLTNITEGGAYVLNLFNIQSGGISLLFLAFFEVITISWGYGTDRFVADIERMVGRRILPWWAFAWKYFSPAVILGVFIFSLYSWKGVTYGTYQYPPEAEFFGWLLALASMLWIPGMAIYMVREAPGSSFSERLRMAFTPNQEIAKQIEMREGYPANGGEMVIV